MTPVPPADPAVTPTPPADPAEMPLPPADPAAWLAAAPATREDWIARLDGAAAVRLGWGLHAASLAAWTREPAAIAPAAALLAALARRFADAAELGAVAEWVAGYQALAEGRMDAALAALERAGVRFAAAGDEPHAAQCRVPQLMALSMLGRHAEAAELAHALADRFVALGDVAAAGRTELNLGSILMRQDRYAESAQAYRRAAVRFARVGDRAHSVMADIGLALALTWQCSFDEAERILARAARRAAAHGLPALQALADTNRGRAALLRGQHAEALALLRSALHRAAEAGTAPQRWELERHLADAYLSLQLLPEALQLYEGLLARADDGRAVEAGWIALRCAELHQRRGAPRAASTQLARAGVALAANPVGRAACALMAARLALGEGDAASAAPQAAEARRAFEAAGVGPWALEASIVEAAILGERGDAPAALALLDTARGALATAPAATRAEAALLRAALRARLALPDADRDAEQALAVLEAERAALPDDEFRVALGALHQRCHEAWCGLLERRAEPPTPLQWLQALDRGRAGALALAGADPPAAAPADDAWRWLHREWQSALAAGRDDEAARLLARVQQAEQAWQSQRRLDAAARGSGLRGGPADAVAGGGAGPALDEAALHAALGPGRALVAYHRQGARLQACVVAGGCVRRIEWQVDDLDDRIDGTRFQIEALRAGTTALGAAAAQQLERTRRRLRDLGECLWAPLAAVVGDAAEVVLLPHGALHGVPFAALADAGGTLVERHAFVAAPGVAAWLRLQGRARPLHEGGLRALVAGAGGAALPQVAAELERVAAALAGPVECLAEAEATVAALRARAPGAGVLHLACHGHFRGDNPDFSTLQLADGVLALHEIMGWRLQARLVALSACETGLARLRPGEELIGLVRGFLVAGAERVLASLWTVADDATAELMGRFYAALRAGASPARALQQAQQDTARERPHPFHWAAFGLHGAG